MRERDILDGNDDGGSFGKAGWRKWLQRIGRSKEVRMKGCLQSGGETRTAISVRMLEEVVSSRLRGAQEQSV